jgi:hypothetical protein
MCCERMAREREIEAVVNWKTSRFPLSEKHRTEMRAAWWKRGKYPFMMLPLFFRPYHESREENIEKKDLEGRKSIRLTRYLSEYEASKCHGRKPYHVA